MKSIRQTSYREYLQDYFEAERSRERTASMKSFSSRLGMSESGLRMILSGKRNLTVHNIHLISKGLKFSPLQTEIFEAMVLRDQAESEAERLYYSKRLKEKSDHYSLNDIKIGNNQSLKEWYSPALLLHLRENGLNSENLTRQMRVSISQKLGISIEKLEDTLRIFDHTGCLSTAAKTNEHLIFDQLTSTNAQISYIKNCFSLAIRRVDTDYKPGRSLFSVKCVSIAEHKIREFGNDYKSMLERYMASSENEKNRKTVQVTFSAINVL
jgi:uncharacterized protein (TIGR02147 family)